MRAAAGLLAALLLAGTPAQAAAPAFADPWPDPDAPSAVRAEDVAFPTASPFTPAAWQAGDVPPATGRGRLFLPPRSGRAAPAPAVILLHGAGGMIHARSDVYGEQLAAMGVAVLAVDTFGARRALGTTFAERVLNITETMFVADAYAALRWLAARGDVDARRVALVGFSYGGMAATYALHEQMARLAAPDGLRFAGHVAFYAPCIARFAERRTTGAPLLMLYGTGDELMDPARCEEVAADLREGGSAVEVRTYAGAVHQWDGGLSRRAIGRNLADCRLRVEPDGTVRDARSGLPMAGPLLRRVILGLCVTDEPYLIGRDDAVRARSNRDLGRFLARVFGG